MANVGLTPKVPIKKPPGKPEFQRTHLRRLRKTDQGDDSDDCPPPLVSPRPQRAHHRRLCTIGLGDDSDDCQSCCPSPPLVYEFELKPSPPIPTEAEPFEACCPPPPLVYERIPTPAKAWTSPKCPQPGHKRFVQYSFATEDGLHLNQCREAVSQMNNWRNCDLIEYGTRDEYWIECWENGLKSADAAVVFDSKYYRQKMENANKSALKKEARMIMDMFSQGCLALFVLDPEVRGGGPNDLVALLQSGKHKEMNARQWQRYVINVLGQLSSNVE